MEELPLPELGCLLLLELLVSTAGGLPASGSAEGAPLLGEVAAQSAGLLLETPAGCAGGEGDEGEDAG